MHDERTTADAAATGTTRFAWNGRLVAIGASAGGVEALTTLISQFPANCPATLIVQHIPESFTARFARRLNTISAAQVLEAYNGAPLEAGLVYIAPGGRHLEVRANSGGFRCRLSNGKSVNGFRPSVDALFVSIAAVAGGRALGVIVSGMGRDGVNGLKAMRDAGARTLGQDESSSTVYGMPKAAFEIGAVERQVPIGDLALEILKICNIHSAEVQRCPTAQRSAS